MSSDSHNIRDLLHTCPQTWFQDTEYGASDGDCVVYQISLQTTNELTWMQ